MDMELRGLKWKKQKAKWTKLIGVNCTLTKIKKNKGECLTWHKIKEENDGGYYLNIFLAMIKPHRLELMGLLVCPIQQPLRIFLVQELC